MLPQELYVHIYEYANDINTTKMLRLVCKVSYNASYDYFKMLLNSTIYVKCNTDKLFLGYDTYCNDVDYCHAKMMPKKTAFPIKMKDLYTAIKKDKYDILMCYNCACIECQQQSKNM